MIILYTCVGIVYQVHIDIINQVINVGASVIRTVSLIQYGSDQPVDKEVWIIEVALYPE